MVVTFDLDEPRYARDAPSSPPTVADGHAARPVDRLAGVGRSLIPAERKPCQGRRQGGALLSLRGKGDALRAPLTRCVRFAPFGRHARAEAPRCLICAGLRDERAVGRSLGRRRGRRHQRRSVARRSRPERTTLEHCQWITRRPPPQPAAPIQAGPSLGAVSGLVQLRGQWRLEVLLSSVRVAVPCGHRSPGFRQRSNYPFTGKSSQSRSTVYLNGPWHASVGVPASLIRARASSHWAWVPMTTKSCGIRPYEMPMGARI